MAEKDLTRKCVSELVSRLMRMPAQVSDDPTLRAQDYRDDLGKAIERYAQSDDHARRAIGELADTSVFRPQTAEIRQWLLDTPTRAVPKPKCEKCDGTGSITIWKLITYKNNSYSIEKSERLNMNFEQMRAFSERIAAKPGDPRQIVLSAAEACECVAKRAAA